MSKKINFRVLLYVLGSIVMITFAVIMYLMNMPHRDVQSTNTDFKFTSSEIVNEYLADPQKADQKYLDSEGDSKVLEITGLIADLSKDFQENTVVLLKSENDKAGVSCTFSLETNSKASSFKLGDKIVVKGVIRSGASYDSDLDLYENVNLEKCDIIN